jgi:hypothetical protein
MPCAIRDASMVTLKNRNKALNAYYNDWKAATVTATGATVSQAVTPPAATSAEVIAEIREGCAACYAVSNNQNKVLGLTYDTNISLYPDNRSAGGASGLTGQS